MKTQTIKRIRVLWLLAAAVSAAALANELPQRQSPIPRTTDGVPHLQIGVDPVPELSSELLKRVADMPGVVVRNTVISLPGARGFNVKDGIQLTRPEVIVGGREFAHMHPDGSLHASLPLALANDAIAAGWAVAHPWADQRPGWAGFVMIFTPTTADELAAVLDLVDASYRHVTQ
ncbi:DUF5519 family protein [Gammaproteobacteria bacterium]|nr:DUF5519 family protein [Gammaproteobacteria bacterium]